MILSKAADTLHRLTWLSLNHNFMHPENINEKEWDYIGDLINEDYFTDDQITIISVFAFLMGRTHCDVKLSQIAKLPDEERGACIEALKFHWQPSKTQEDL
jgi:hypothetical protein